MDMLNLRKNRIVLGRRDRQRIALRMNKKGRVNRPFFGPFEWFHNHRLNVTIVLLLALLLCALIWLEMRLRPAIIRVTETQLKSLATRTIHQTVRAHMAIQEKGEPWILWKTDASGRIRSMEWNQSLVARTTNELMVISQHAMERLKGFTSKVPLGQMFHSPWLAALGPKLPIYVEPLGRTDVEIKTSTKPAGINMVLIEVNAYIRTDITALFPMEPERQVVETVVPLSLAMIVGDVPVVRELPLPNAATTGKD